MQGAADALARMWRARAAVETKTTILALLEDICDAAVRTCMVALR